MSDYQPRIWECHECGMVLGFVLRGGDRRAKLNVLAHGCHPLLVSKLGDPRVIVYKIYDLEQGVVHCDWCGARRRWIMSDDALDQLRARRKVRTFGLDISWEGDKNV